MAQSNAAPNTTKLSKLQDQVSQVEKLVQTDKVDKAKCDPLLTQLKIGLIEANALPPFHTTIDPNTLKSVIELGTRIYESAALYSVKTNDMSNFQRYVNTVKMYYFDYKSVGVQSKHKSEIIGLYLLYLLSDNKIEQFHIEIEFLNKYYSDNTQQNLVKDPYISFALLLEQYLMDGSYNKIIHTKVPNSSYTVFYNNLIHTVQEKIADGVQIAYTTYPIKQLSKLLMIQDSAALQNFIQSRQWTVQGDNVVFSDVNNEYQQAKHSIPAHETMKNTLVYAAELEKIV